MDDLTSLVDLSKISKLRNILNMPKFMKKITATELKIKTGEYLHSAQKEPLAVQRNGRTVAVLLAYEDYERLTKLENAYWIKRAEAAEKEGFLGVRGSARFLREQLKKHAQD